MSITLIITLVTTIISLIALSQQDLIDKLVFYPYRIWHNKEIYRLLTGGFIHANIPHLLFNMISFYSFGTFVEYEFSTIFSNGGNIFYGLLYISAILTADVFNLFKSKNDPTYRSLGASGAVSAVIFSAILLQPMGTINIFFSLPIPAYMFGPLYLVYCAYMANRGTDNIGHTAHFTGAIYGFFLPVIFKPTLLSNFIDQVSQNI